MDPILTLAPGLCRNRDAALSREWLVTNGVGGYALGSVAGASTRAYHGYLVAATAPPVGRTMLLQHVAETLTVAGAPYELGCDELSADEVAPAGFAHLVSFALDGTLPVWRYAVGGAVLEKRVWMAHGQNTTYLRYTVIKAPGPVTLALRLDVADRDHHAFQAADGSSWSVARDGDALQILHAAPAATPWRAIPGAGASWTPQGQWSAPIWLRVEAERGLPPFDQRYALGSFVVSLAPGADWTLIVSAEPGGRVERDADAALRAEQARQAALLATAGAVGADSRVRQLVLAADQFVVERDVAGAAGVERGHTVIAGYPWFGDWGRDTMISLPGLCLATGRYDVARSILRTFARFVSEGMLPNRFPDQGEQPEYNTVDATLWYFQALGQYVDITGDEALVAELYPTLAEIVAWHVRGTRYGIGVDPADGLLRAGTPGAQLTWMDVRIDEALLADQAPALLAHYRALGRATAPGYVVTPRHGKAVEINALWYRALQWMAAWAPGQALELAVDYAALADRVAAGFGRFWYSAGGYLYDVLDTPAGDDPTLRPNQVFALSLAPELLSADQRRSALAAVGRWLWTPLGLRTLDPRHPDYEPRFTGDRVQRDGAYHQGTVWPWLIGHYVDARRAVEPTCDPAPLLAPLLDHLWDTGLGTVSEVFDAEPPRFGAGCMAQAWSVAELLRSLRHADSTRR